MLESAAIARLASEGVSMRRLQRAFGALVLTASLGLAADDELAPLPSGPETPHRHELTLVQGRAGFADGVFASSGWERVAGGVVLAREGAQGSYRSPTWSLAPFTECLPSWNVEVPAGAGVAIELRVGAAGELGWSPWLFVGQWGRLPERYERRVDWERGRVDVDWFRGSARFERAQLRVLAWRGAGGSSPVLRRLALCSTDREPSSPPAADVAPEPARELWQRALEVPLRRQGAEEPALAARICSPTSVSMMLAYRGVERPTAEVARALWDPLHDLYGNWPRAVQGAYAYGVPGYLARFNDWRSVRRAIADGQPLVCSIAAQEGELTGAPYARTAGHLIVIVGFDEAGDVLVNDPAAPELESVRRTYARAELEHCWMRRGGTAYVIEAAGSLR